MYIVVLFAVILEIVFGSLQNSAICDLISSTNIDTLFGSSSEWRCTGVNSNTIVSNPCASGNIWSYVSCSSGSIVELDLGFLNIEGNLPSTIGLLTDLVVFNISGNSFTGNLPTGFGNMEDLSILSISKNSFSGNLPSEIFSAVSLEYVEFGTNSFTGTIPTTICQLLNLTYLTISQIDSQFICYPSCLDDLGISNSDFVSVTSTTPKCPELNAYDILCDIVSTTNLNSLQPDAQAWKCDLSSKLLYSDPCTGYNGTDILGIWEGVECEDISGKIYITSLNFTDSLISGQLPTVLGLLSSLTALEMHETTSFNTDIPSELGDLANLKTLIFHNAGVTGVLPSTIGKLAKLEILSISHSNLSGSIPSTFGLMTKLSEINLNYNSLNGFIPSEIASLPSLSSLMLISNELQGTVPAEFCDSFADFSLQIMNISYNDFIYCLSDCLLSLSDTEFDSTRELAILQCSDADKWWPICSIIDSTDWTKYNETSNAPYSFICSKGGSVVTNPCNSWSIPDGTTLVFPILCDGFDIIESINLYGISSGVLPPAIGELTGLIAISTHASHMHGEIPLSLCGLTKLTNLFLADNSFSGKFPSCIGDLTALLSINLEINSLSGTIPYMGDIFGLSILRLSNNLLSGSLSGSLCNLTDLQVLDVSGNSDMTCYDPCLSFVPIFVTEFQTKEGTFSECDVSKDTTIFYVTIALLCCVGLFLCLCGNGLLMRRAKVPRKFARRKNAMNVEVTAVNPVSSGAAYEELNTQEVEDP